MTCKTTCGAATGRRTWRAWLVLVLLAWLSACSPPQPPIRVGLLAWPPYELARLAGAKGYFDTSRIELVEFQSPAEASRAYAVGGLDVVALTLDYVFDLHARSDDHRVFLVIDESHGGDVAISRAPISGLAQIKGLRVGLEAGPLGAHMLHRLLDKAGLRPQDVTLVYFDIPDQQQAFADGNVDIMITYDPVRSKLLQAGGHQIFSSRDIPGEIIDVFVARDSLMRARKEDVRHFTQGWFRALEQTLREPEGSAALMAPRLGLSAQEFRAALTGVQLPSLADNHRFLGARDQAFIDGVTRFARSVNEASGQLVPARMERLFTPDMLPDDEAAQ